MKKSRKPIIITVIAIAAAAAVAIGLYIGLSDRPGGVINSGKTGDAKDAAPKASSEPGTVQIYASVEGANRSYYDYAAAAFAERWPGYTLKLIEASDISDDDQTLKGMAAQSTLPDIFEVTPAMAETLSETGQAADLKKALSGTADTEAGSYGASLYPISLKEAESSDKKICYFPYKGQDLWLWYYDREIFEKAGATVPEDKDSLIIAVNALKEYGVTPVAVAGAEDDVICGLYDSLAVGFVPEGIAGLDDDKSISDAGYDKAAEVLGELSSAGAFENGAEETGRETARGQFLDGKAAMILEDAAFMDEIPADKKQSTGIIAIPGSAEGHYAGGGAVGGFAVDTAGIYGDEAVEMAAFIAKKYTEAMSQSGSVLTAADTGAASDSAESVKALQEALRKAVSVTMDPKDADPALTEKLSFECRGLISGRYTATEFVTDLKDALDQQ